VGTGVPKGRWKGIAFSALIRSLQVVRLQPGLLGLFDRLAVAPEAGRWLDVGCGDGSLLGIASRLGWHVTGVEPDKLAAEVVVRWLDGDVKPTTLPAAKLPDGHFDVITMMHILEHLHDVDETLAEAERVLKPGGVLILVTPNADSLGHKLMGSRWPHLEPGRHLHLFNKATLRARVEAVLGIEAVWTTPRNARWSWPKTPRFQRLQRTVRGPLNLPGMVLQTIETAGALPPLRRPWGEELVLVARKPVSSLARGVSGN